MIETRMLLLMRSNTFCIIFQLKAIRGKFAENSLAKVVFLSRIPAPLYLFPAHFLSNESWREKQFSELSLILYV